MYVCMYIALIKFDEWVDTTDLYNKRVILGLRNFVPFNERIGRGGKI